MRLLFISHSFPPRERPLANVGGMQRMATELHAALARHPGVELSSLVLRTSWRWTPLRFPGFAARLLLRIPALVRADRIDVVLFSSMVTAALLPLLRARLQRQGARTALMAHGQDVTLPSRIWQQVVGRVLAHVDRALSISRATGVQCLERGLPPERLRVTPCGIDPARFPPLRDRPTLRRELLADVGEAGAALPLDALLLCSVGRQVKRKGFAWFVEHVMPRLPVDVHYWIAGDGPERSAIREAAERAGVHRRVRLLGRVPESTLIALYRGADLFVMPNIRVPGDMEGFGIVMLEAGMCGLPTVGARLEGIEDVITDGVNGRLVPDEDARAFARAILAYHADRQELAAAAERAAGHVRATFSWDALLDRYLDAMAPA